MATSRALVCTRNGQSNTCCACSRSHGLPVSIRAASFLSANRLVATHNSLAILLADPALLTRFRETLCTRFQRNVVVASAVPSCFFELRPGHFACSPLFSDAIGDVSTPLLSSLSATPSIHLAQDPLSLLLSRHHQNLPATRTTCWSIATFLPSPSLSRPAYTPSRSTSSKEKVDKHHRRSHLTARTHLYALAQPSAYSYKPPSWSRIGLLPSQTPQNQHEPLSTSSAPLPTAPVPPSHSRKHGEHTNARPPHLAHPHLTCPRRACLAASRSQASARCWVAGCEASARK